MFCLQKIRKFKLKDLSEALQTQACFCCDWWMRRQQLKLLKSGEWMEDLPETTRKELQKVFDIFDHDHDSTLTESGYNVLYFQKKHTFQ